MIKRKLGALFSVLFLLGTALMLNPPLVFAGPPDPSIFDGQEGCNLANPSSCRCVIAFRDRDTLSVLAYSKGGDDRNNMGDTLVGLPKGKHIQYSIFLYEDTADKREDQCYTAQGKSSATFEWQDLGGSALLGCAVGGFVPVANIIACPLGAVTGMVLSGEVVDGISKLSTGSWSKVTRSEDYNCNWNGNYAISDWDNISYGFNSDRLSRIEAWGVQDFVGVDGLDRDVFYCGALLAKREGVALDGTMSYEDFDLCKQAGEKEDECLRCFSNQNAVWTAFGCIPTRLTGLIQAVMAIGLSISGGIALLMIIIAAYMFSISQGDPKRTNVGKEILTAAIIGLLFTIFSVFLLQLIGSDILKIPGFGV